jgi:hypothetical protein
MWKILMLTITTVHSQQQEYYGVAVPDPAADSSERIGRQALHPSCHMLSLLYGTTNRRTLPGCLQPIHIMALQHSVLTLCTATNLFLANPETGL